MFPVSHTNISSPSLYMYEKNEGKEAKLLHFNSFTGYRVH